MDGRSACESVTRALLIWDLPAVLDIRCPILARRRRETPSVGITWVDPVSLIGQEAVADAAG